MKRLFLVILAVVISTGCFAQFSTLDRSVDRNEWLFSLGVNSINSLGTKNPFEGLGDWGYKYPLALNIESRWTNLLAIDVGLSLNGFNEGQRLDTSGPPERDLTYFAVDVALKYYFGEYILPKAEWIDFYAAAGPGLFILDNTNISLNAGGGVVFWFGRSKSYGLKAQGVGKFALNHSNSGSDYANNHFQYSLQFIIRFSK
ncbi:hypothetical protein [Winogradskyella aurantia]|uniref:Outer membrane protein beta-barrel domain-containing protein n=1 Tax=Winogradskyella aurantia TaxID=1915063 RepID=A0A265UVB3_9FLAO|nr:hypothetical protein [Winogradskyella aurantia]OZV69255.1 hypothetical protein CA834_07300 [Winogradskyella aurantia]